MEQLFARKRNSLKAQTYRILYIWTAYCFSLVCRYLTFICGRVLAKSWHISGRVAPGDQAYLTIDPQEAAFVPNAPSTITENAMQTSLSAPLKFYPAYCFSLSPTHEAWARLTARDVHALQERAGFEGSQQLPLSL